MPNRLRRVFAYYILDMKEVDIAHAEGVSSSDVCDSVKPTADSKTDRDIRDLVTGVNKLNRDREFPHE